MKKGRFINIESSKSKDNFKELFSDNKVSFIDRVKYELNKLNVNDSNENWYNIDKRVYSYLRYIKGYLEKYDMDTQSNIDPWNVEEYLNYSAVKRWMYLDWKDIDKEDYIVDKKPWSSFNKYEDRFKDKNKRKRYRIKGSNEYADEFYIGKWRSEYKRLTGEGVDKSGLDRYMYFDRSEFGKSYISFDISKFCFDLSKGLFRDEFIADELRNTKGYKYEIPTPKNKNVSDLIYTEENNRSYRFLYWKMKSLKWRNYNQRVMDKILKEEYILGEYFKKGKVELRRRESGYVERRFWKVSEEDSNYVELFVKYGMSKRFDLGDNGGVLLVVNDRDKIRNALLQVYENWVELYSKRMEVIWFNKQKSRAYYTFNAVILDKLGYSKRSFSIDDMNSDKVKENVVDYKVNKEIEFFKKIKKEDILNDKFGMMDYFISDSMDYMKRENYMKDYYVWNDNLRIWVNKNSVKNIMDSL